MSLLSRFTIRTKLASMVIVSAISICAIIAVSASLSQKRMLEDRMGQLHTAVDLMVGMLGISWLDGVIGRRPSILFSYSSSLLGIVMLWLLQWYPNYFLLTGFVVCFGSMIGSRGPLLTATAMKIFRGQRVGTIYGAITIGSGLGSALGSWSGGLLHDWTQSYNPLIAFALISVVIGMIPFLVVPALRR